jgi:hypothetical protein
MRKAMRPAAPLLAVPPQLYKHFAVLTLAITVCVAIFATGENRQLIKQQVERREARKAVVEARFAPRSHTRMVSGLQDNRTGASSGPTDNDPTLVVPVPPTVVSGSEPAFTPALAQLAASARPTRAAKKLPPVLPPGTPARFTVQRGETSGGPPVSPAPPPS